MDNKNATSHGLNGTKTAPEPEGQSNFVDREDTYLKVIEFRFLVWDAFAYGCKLLDWVRPYGRGQGAVATSGHVV